MKEITKTTVAEPNIDYVWLLFVVFAIFVFFFALGKMPLVGPDEPRYAQIAREMFERGDWVTPTLGGFPWFEKPALLYWLQIASYHLFGVSEFSARLGPAIFGVLTVGALFVLGKSMDAGRGYLGSLGKWVFVVGASTLGLVVFARGASFDIILTFPITASLVCFFLFDRAGAGEKRRLKLAGFYVFIGVALLAKGLIGAVLPAGIVFAYFVISRRFPDRTVRYSLVWGSLLSLCIAAVWYVPVYSQNGYRFIDEFFIQHHFQRYLSNKYAHAQPFYYFLWVLPLMTLPWLPLFLASLWNMLSGKPGREESQSSEVQSLRLFAVAWIFVPLLFFSFSGSKLPGYILPALPGAIILTSDLAARLGRRNPTTGYTLFGAAFATLLAVVISLQFFAAPFAERESVKSLIEAANADGYAAARVFNLHIAEHNAEFYAPGRIERDGGGKLRTFYGPSEISETLRQNGSPNALVLVPLEYVSQLTENDALYAKVIADNGRVAIVYAEEKR
jgi:4-amino-4-deoxy-L-arabinose transferase-like glycosyltransferase